MKRENMPDDQKSSHTGLIVFIIVFIIFLLLGIFLFWYFALRKSEQGGKCQTNDNCVAPLVCLNQVCTTKPVPRECNSNTDCINSKVADSYCNLTNYKCEKLSNISCQTNTDCPNINEVITGFYDYTTKNKNMSQTILSSFCYHDDLTKPGFCAYGKTCSDDIGCKLERNLYLAPVILPDRPDYLKTGTVNTLLVAGDQGTGCLNRSGKTPYCTY